MAAWDVRTAYRQLVEELYNGDLLAARWRAEGIYGGGIPGAKAPAGTAISFGGRDFLRFREDRFVEFWGGADDSHLMSQLGLLQSG